MKKTEINVLIVEDDKTQLEALSKGIERRGYRPVPVSRPEEAASVVKIKPIHVLIVDVMLPGKNGVDLVLGLKENLLDGAAIYFTSGVYRDRGFIADAVKNSGAIEYFIKPFDIEKLLTSLEKQLAAYVDVPKIDLYNLLATPFASERERRRALDHVESITGYDLPFVFCILADSKSSGHLNIVDEKQNISGITFCQGKIVKVDSENTILQTKKLLIQHGFITERELSEFKGQGSGHDLVKSLINEGLMSPHVPSIIQTETIVAEIAKLIIPERININFVPDRKIEPSSDHLDMSFLIHQLNDFIQTIIPADWLKSFYKPWSGFPVQQGPGFKDLAQFANLSTLQAAKHLIPAIKDDITIDELISSNIANEEIVLKALHLLMLRRVFVFKETRKAVSFDEHIGRIRSMYEALHDKNPFEIFKYFGLGEKPKPADVARVYKEFAKANHPDILPAKIDPEIKKLNDDLFSKVTAAYEILSNEEKRQAFMNSLKQAEAEMQIKSDELVTTAAAALNKGRYSEGLQALLKAEKLYSSERSRLHLLWAKLKLDGQMPAEQLPEAEDELRKMSAGTRNTGLWHYVFGLCKVQQGDIKVAQDYVRKALQEDANLMDARRELVALKAQVPKKLSTEDILTGDISQVIKGFFGGKKGA